MASKWDPAIWGRAQLALDGRLGKDFVVTDYMGWRMHPIHKERRHHNGTDICSKHSVAWVEAPYYGKVIFAKDTTEGFGTHVMLYHQINGREYVTVYAHLEKGSLKVKVGQRVKAGTPLGKMGSTGASTGRHLHWECVQGARYKWSSTGVGFVEPIKFFTAVAAQEKAILRAAQPAPVTAQVLTKPVEHSFEAGLKLQAEIESAKASGVKTTDASGGLALPTDPHAEIPKTTVEATAPAPQPAPAVVQEVNEESNHSKNPGYPGTYLKLGSTDNVHVRYIQQQLHLLVDGVFGQTTHDAVVRLQKAHGLDSDGVIGPKTWAALG